MTASIRSDGDPAASRANRVVVWSPEYLSYRWSADHPMNPTRLDLTMALSRSLGLLEGIEFLEPSAASDATSSESTHRHILQRSKTRVTLRTTV